jgi:hypothetical protein
MPPPMPKRVASIKRAIEEQQDFTGLAGGGEAEVFAWARAHGMRGGALVLEWHQNYRQAQGARNQGVNNTLKNPPNLAAFQRGKTPQTELRLDDLDYWADDTEPDEPDDDDELTLKTKVCDNCRGLGLTSDGVRCSRCKGSGRIDRDDVDDGSEDDDWKEDDDE